MMVDLAGWCLRVLPEFRGKPRLVEAWQRRRQVGDRRRRKLPGGGVLECDVGVPYEAMIWLRREEEEELALVRELLAPGDVFVDFGANIGLWTLVAAAAVGKEGRVIAIEPEPRSCARLRDHLTRSKFFHVEVIAAAAGAREGSGMLAVGRSANVSTLVEKTVPGVTRRVPVITADSVVHGARVHGMKIDVEGGEASVLEGAQEIITTWHPWLVVEFNAELAGVARLDDWNVHRVLLEQGYRAWAADGRSALHGELDGYRNLFYAEERDGIA